MEEKKDNRTYVNFYFADTVGRKTAMVIMEDLREYLDRCWARCAKCNRYFKRAGYNVCICPECKPKKVITAETKAKIKATKAAKKAKK